MSGQLCLDLEIGTTIADLQDLLVRGIPDPTSWTFSPYSRTEVGGDGRSRGFGFGRASWTFEVLSQGQLDAFLTLFSAATDASRSLFIQTYTDSGRGTGDMRARYQAVMHRPVDGDGKTMWPDSRTPVYRDVTVNFTRLESA